jgi:Ca2+-binding EF-hand superfamily protein
MKTTLIAFCAALLSTAAIANDNDSADRKNDRFASLDADSDGKLSKDEVAGNSSLSSSFSMIDRNSDGYITRGEFRRNVRSKPGR